MYCPEGSRDATGKRSRQVAFDVPTPFAWPSGAVFAFRGRPSKKMSAVRSLKRLEAKEDGPMRHQPRVLALLLIRSAFGLFAQALVAAAPAAGQPAPVAGGQQPPVMQRDEEIALALSACPPFVASKAAVYVLDRTGYVKARDGQN